MHFTLLVAGALSPAKLALALSAALNTPSLKARLSRAAFVSGARSESTFAQGSNAHLDWLAQKLFSQVSPAPTAPYALAQISGAIPQRFVWHADPVHVEVARDHMVVQSLDADSPDTDETTQLIGVANELLSGLHCELVISKGRWFLLTEPDWTIDAAPLAAVIGSSVMMPTGPDARTWNRLHNEIQIAWHAHSVNQTRDDNGQRTINALWLHGGGRWKPLSPTKFSQVHSDVPEWQGAALAAGAHGYPLDADLVNGALIVIDAPVVPRQREDWAGWLQTMNAVDQRLAVHDDDAIDLVLTGATVRTFASRRSDRYKPWRRRSLAEALTE